MLSSKEQIPIFNYVNGKRNPISWGELFERGYAFSYAYASALSVWYYFYISTKNIKWFNFLRFWLHTTPAYLADTVLKLMGKKPM